MNRRASYGPPILMVVIGLVTVLALNALALNVFVEGVGVNLTMIGWILAGLGVLWLLLVAYQNNKSNTTSSVESVTDSQGRSSQVERETETS